MKRQQVRQGDVFLEKSDSSIPKDAVKVKSENKRLILRRGEATGHHHSVDYRKAEEYFHRVHPELRPLQKLPNGMQRLGDPQEMTPKNAIASTFGRRGEEYNPQLQS